MASDQGNLRVLVVGRARQACARNASCYTRTATPRATRRDHPDLWIQRAVATSLAGKRSLGGLLARLPLTDIAPTAPLAAGCVCLQTHTPLPLRYSTSVQWVHYREGACGYAVQIIGCGPAVPLLGVRALFPAMLLHAPSPTRPLGSQKCPVPLN